MPRVYFADTSALAKRYVTELGTGWLQGLLAPPGDCSLYIVRITQVELIAAITRRERGATITPPDAVAARTAFRIYIVSQYNVIEFTSSLAHRAMTLAEAHGLRGYDAIQLAAALAVNTSYNAVGLPTITLISADAELNAAALLEGLNVEDPNNHP